MGGVVGGSCGVGVVLGSGIGVRRDGRSPGLGGWISGCGGRGGFIGFWGDSAK
jgi:hypothetical protein